MTAKEVVNAIFDDLNDRRGFRQTIDEVDEDILEEMKEGWEELVADAINDAEKRMNGIA